MVELCEIAEVKLGRQRSPKHHVGNSMHSYLRAANVGWAGLQLEDVKEMNFTDAEMESFRLRPGDVLLNEASGSPREVGKPAIWNGELEDCAFQNTLLRVRPNKKCDSRYLLHFFTLQAFSGAFAQGSRGVGIRHLGREALARWPIPLLVIDEQRRIVAILDQADALRTKRRQVLSHLSTLSNSVFRDLFGTADLPSAPLAELADVTSGITKGRRTSEPTSPTPYLAVSNVQTGHLSMDVVREIAATASEIERYTLRDGDLVLTEGGDPDKLGRGTIWRSELPVCIHQNHIFRVRIKHDATVLPEYLEAYMASLAARSYFLRCAKQTTGIASINMAQLRALPVRVPPMDRQHAYLERVDLVSRQRAAVKAALAADDELFASLQSRAFRGEL